MVFSTRFEGWYLRQHFSKRKILSAGLLLVVLSVTMLSAGPTLYYFYIANREGNTMITWNSLVQVGFGLGSLNQSELADLAGLPGVQRVIPMVQEQVSISTNGRAANELVYFISTSDTPEVFSLFGFSQSTTPSPTDWLYLGHTAAGDLGVPVGSSTQVTVKGIGSMTAMGAQTTYSDSDFNTFGDIQAYWNSTSDTRSGEYNGLLMVASDTNAANALGPILTTLHPGWHVSTPSEVDSGRLSAPLGQLQFALSLGAISWIFGLVMLGTYVGREVSAQSKELVTLAALGAPRSTLTRCLSYYLLILTTAGCLTGLVLSLYVVTPAYEILSFGYTLTKAYSTIAYTVGVTLAPVLALDIAIVLVLQRNLNRLEMMNFLRAEV